MKIVLIITLLLIDIPFALTDDGKAIYDKVCSQCHVMQMGWQIKDKTVLKAPHFPGVTRKVRAIYSNEAQFVEFVSRYIEKPTRIRSRMGDAAIERFGLMPDIGADMSKDERKTIARWMFHNVGAR